MTRALADGREESEDRLRSVASRYAKLLDCRPLHPNQPDGDILGYLSLTGQAYRGFKAALDAVIAIPDWEQRNPGRIIPQDFTETVELILAQGEWERGSPSDKASSARAHFDLANPRHGPLSKESISTVDGEAYAAHHAKVVADKTWISGEEFHRLEVAYRSPLCPGGVFSITVGQPNYAIRVFQVCLLLPESYVKAANATLDTPVFFSHFPGEYSATGNWVLAQRKIWGRRGKRGRDGMSVWFESLLAGPSEVERTQNWPIPIFPVYIGAGLQLETW